MPHTQSRQPKRELIEMDIFTHADPLNDSELARLAEDAMELYPPPVQGEPRLFTRSENATFRIDAGSQSYALRIHRSRYHQKQDIESELAWLDALDRDLGIHVPRPVSSERGERVLTLIAPDGTHRHAVLFRWMEGTMPTTDVEPQSFQRLGEITARLHQHSRNWLRPEGFHRIIWNHETMVGSNAHWGDWHDVPGLSPEDVSTIETAVRRIDEQMDAFGKSPERYGLIHADLRLTNLLLHDGDTRVIDFDDCGLGWFMHDLAAAISFEEHHPGAPEWIRNWLEGYERVTPIGDEERSLIPAFITQRRIQMTSWVGSHSQTAMARSLGPEWLGHTVRLCCEFLNSSTPWQ